MMLKSQTAGSRILLIRPGATEFDEQGRIKGSLDIPMSPRGREQTDSLVESLASVPVKVIYAAPCESAKETAQRLAEQWGRQSQGDRCVPQHRPRLVARQADRRGETEPPQSLSTGAGISGRDLPPWRRVDSRRESSSPQGGSQDCPPFRGRRDRNGGTRPARGCRREPAQRRRHLQSLEIGNRCRPVAAD